MTRRLSLIVVLMFSVLLPVALPANAAARVPSKVGILRSSTSVFLNAQDLNGNIAWDQGVDQAGNFGIPGDVLIFGDWNGSGTTKIGIYRPSSAMFALDMNGNGQWDPGIDVAGNFGVLGDTPIVGDWNGTGRTKIGIYRPSNGQFALDINGNLAWDQGTDATGIFGSPNGTPVVGDWMGVGFSRVGIFRDGHWVLDANGDLAVDGGDLDGYIGAVGDTPILGDWNGDGRTKVGIYRPSNSEFGLDYNGNLAWDVGVDLAGIYGQPGDTPIVGDWTGSGVTRIGIFRGGYWALDSNGNIAWDVGVDADGFFGIAGDTPIVGRWYTGSSMPTISFSAPLNGSVVLGATVYLLAAVSDTVNISTVQFFLDGSPLGAPLTTASYETVWNSTLSANGAHILTALVTDVSRSTAFASPITVTVANILQNPVTLSVQNTGAGAGAVTAAGGINCGTSCQATVNAGTMMTFTAQPAAGSIFAGWSGACTGQSLLCTATVNASVTLTASFALPSGQSAVFLTDFVEMNNGTDGDVVTPAIAASDTLPLVGASGAWANGPAGPPVQLYVSTSSGIAIPPRGPVQIGATLIPDTGSTGMFRKHAGIEYDFLAYDFSPTLTNPTVSVGLYMYFTGAGWATAVGNVYDTFAIESVNGDFMTINMVAGPSLMFRIETQECPSAVAVASGSINKWYWFTASWDQPTLLATLKIYDPSTWGLVGSASCNVTNDPLSAIWLGNAGNHGNAAIDADFYMDDLMIDISGAHNAANPLLPAAAFAASSSTSPSH